MSSGRVGRCDCVRRIGSAVPIADAVGLFRHVLVSPIVQLICLTFVPGVAASIRHLC